MAAQAGMAAPNPLLYAYTALVVVSWVALAVIMASARDALRPGGALEQLKVGEVLSWQATGLAIGSACSGLAGECLRSRKRVIWICFAAMAALVLAILLRGRTPAIYCRLMDVRAVKHLLQHEH